MVLPNPMRENDPRAELDEIQRLTEENDQLRAKLTEIGQWLRWHDMDGCSAPAEWWH